MTDQKPAANQEETAPSPKRSLLENKVVLLGAIVILQIVMAVGITQFVVMPKLAVHGAAMQAGFVAPTADGDSEMGVIVGLEEIIVTLRSDSSAPSYLRINVNLEVESQKVADLVLQRLPQLRDAVILALSSKKAEDLITPEGNLAVRSEIFRQLSQKLPEESLRNIYFSDLVIQ